jgi:hypothetical protein
MSIGLVPSPSQTNFGLEYIWYTANKKIGILSTIPNEILLECPPSCRQHATILQIFHINGGEGARNGVPFI